MYGVSGLEGKGVLANWKKSVSSVLLIIKILIFSKEKISFLAFIPYLQEKYLGFSVYKYRLLFYSGYNSMLWSTCFQNKINRYGWFGAMIKISDRLRYRTNDEMDLSIKT